MTGVKESQEDSREVERSQERDRRLNISSSAPSLPCSVYLPLQHPYRIHRHAALPSGWV